jgi:GNAT superfamily N-acetyltransferase
MTVHLSAVSLDLPEDVARLQAACIAEGMRHLERLVDEWRAGLQRFDRPGECLLIARSDGEIAGVGGLTEDPAIPSAFRMRRFYVLPRFRRAGIARALVAALLTRAPPGRSIGVHVGPPGAYPFWEAMGFRSVVSDHITHLYRGEGA